MKRRELPHLGGGLAAALAQSSVARTEQARKFPTIGVLWHAANEADAAFLGALRAGFVDHGYIEGRTQERDNRYVAEQCERLESNAAALVAGKVDVLVAVTRQGWQRNARQAKFQSFSWLYPMRRGSKMVASPARPGGNVTGSTHRPCE